METKKVEKVNVLAISLQTSLSNLLADTQSLGAEIMYKATDLNLKITGPQIWHYEGCDGKPETPFLLTIAIPIQEPAGTPGKFRFDELPAATVLSSRHKGPWNTLGETYQKMMAEIQTNNLPFNGNCRELYWICDFENQGNCITEIQTEIA